jgi:hypothetical protein
MTAAQLKKEKYVKEKLASMLDHIAEDAGSATISQRPLFKLKRFLEVEPRTSTKRGSSPFMLSNTRNGEV